MALKILPDVELLRRLFSYDHKTGELRHKRRPLTMFSDQRGCDSWNSRCAGKLAGCSRPDGYILVAIFDVKFRANRVIWKLFYGTDPPAVIDHINGIPDDNRIANLRAVTQSQNIMNACAHKDSISGLRGVSPHKSRFVARIMANGVEYYLGLFPTIHAARSAREAAECRLHGKFIPQKKRRDRRSTSA